MNVKILCQHHAVARNRSGTRHAHSLNLQVSGLFERLKERHALHMMRSWEAVFSRQAPLEAVAAFTQALPQILGDDRHAEQIPVTREP